MLLFIPLELYLPLLCHLIEVVITLLKHNWICYTPTVG